MLHLRPATLGLNANLWGGPGEGYGAEPHAPLVRGAGTCVEGGGTHRSKRFGGGLLVRRKCPLCTVALEVNRLPSVRLKMTEVGQGSAYDGGNFLKGLPMNVLSTSPLPIHPPDHGQKDSMKMTIGQHRCPYLNPSVAAHCTGQEIQNPSRGLIIKPLVVQPWPSSLAVSQTKSPGSSADQAPSDPQPTHAA